MENNWDRLKTNLRAGMKIVSKKADELTRIGRLKLEIVAVKRDIEKGFIELGGRIYHKVDQEQKYDVKGDQEVMDLVTKIRGYEDRMEELEKKIKDIQTISDQDMSGEG